LGHATSVFGAGKFQLFAQDPQQWGVRLGGKFPHLPIHVDFRHEKLLVVWL
jgi:hypothetical protein